MSGYAYVIHFIIIVHQDGEIVREHGERREESIEDMFYLCGDNSDGMRCSACKKEREDLFDVARRYTTYEDRTRNCPAFRIPDEDISTSNEGVAANRSQSFPERNKIQ